MILLVSLYELGRQPLALASALGFLRRAGLDAECLDLAVEPLDEAALARCAVAELVALSVPMHTAARLAGEAIPLIRARTRARIIAFGLYAPLVEGADVVLTGECEDDLIAVARGAGAPARPTLRRLDFAVPARDALPALTRYARLLVAGGSVPAGAVETTRGCKHMCRHCPIPAVYGGRFFAVPADTVVADASGQIAAGARHITFADADFFNAPKHGLAVVRALRARHPEITFDATIKVEHIVAHAELFPDLAAAGCLFVVSAAESLNHHILDILDKGHTAADVERALAIVRGAGISLRPTFVAFTPWTSIYDYLELCHFVLRHDLVDEVDPVQLSLRLLVPKGSLLLARDEMTPHLTDYDAARFTWTWRHPDPHMDALCAEVQTLVAAAADRHEPAVATFARIHDLAARVAGIPPHAPPPRRPRRGDPPPRLSEPWFC